MFCLLYFTIYNVIICVQSRQSEYLNWEHWTQMLWLPWDTLQSASIYTWYTVFRGVKKFFFLEGKGMIFKKGKSCVQCPMFFNMLEGLEFGFYKLHAVASKFWFEDFDFSWQSFKKYCCTFVKLGIFIFCCPKCLSADSFVGREGRGKCLYLYFAC